MTKDELRSKLNGIVVDLVFGAVAREDLKGFVDRLEDIVMEYGND